jgi:cytochrome P450
MTTPAALDDSASHRDDRGAGEGMADGASAPSYPGHVPEHLVFDYDYMRPGPGGSDPLVAATVLHRLPPVVWTPRHGGHWIVTKGELIRPILKDYDRFSSERVFIDTPGRPRGVPLEYDPPEHAPLRRLLMPAFTPKAVAQWTGEARALAVELIDGFRDRGTCEFVAEFARQLPMIILLRILDLPLEHRQQLVHWVSTGLRSVDRDEILAVRRHFVTYIEDLVDRRTAEPGDDVLSKALHTPMEDGKPIPRHMAIGLANALLGGGLDTVATTMTWIAWFLAQSPAHRTELVTEPQLVPNAVNEFLRRFSIANIARVVRNDMEFEGAPLRKGDAILMPTPVHGLDPRSFHQPLEVDFTRPDAHTHSTLSHGVHRCVGATLAHQEIQIFLGEWLRQIPDFSLDPADPPVWAPGIAPGIERLSLRW